MDVKKLHIQAAVHNIYTTFCQCCSALELKKDHNIDDHALRDLCGESVDGVYQEHSVLAEEEDDTSWFFDSSDYNADNEILTQIGLQSIPQLTALDIIEPPEREEMHSAVADNDTATTPTELCTKPGNDIFTHEWFLLGLQHCVPHDYAAQSVDDSVALPMRLAGDVKLHLWDGDLTIKHTQLSIVEELINDMSTTEGSLKASLSKYLHVRVVTGLSVSHSCTLSGSLFLGCQTRDFDKVRSIYTKNNLDTDREARDRSEGGYTAIFHRTVVVCANIGILGENFHEDNSALGNSQQARGICFTNIVTADAYIDSLRANFLYEQSSYVQQICSVLAQHRVDLLLCHAGMMTINLVDCLAVHGIAVLPLQTTQELNSAADLSGAEVMEDILALSDCDIGCRSVSVKQVIDLPIADAKYQSPKVSHQNEEGEGEEQEELCIGGFREDSRDGILQLGGDGSEQQCLVALSSVASERPLNTSNGGALGEEMTPIAETSSPESISVSSPVSVLICAPTEVMTQAISDRFYRCLHRLRAVAEDSGDGGGGSAVIPGAGVLEMVCILRLDEVVAELNAGCAGLGAVDGETADEEMDDDRKEKVHGEVEVIRVFQQVLIEYISTIMLNSGCSYAQSFELANNTLSALRTRVSLFESAISADTSSRTQAFVASLSNEDKIALPQSIQLDDALNGQLVLDVVRLRLASLHSALLLVCELFTTRH